MEPETSVIDKVTSELRRARHNWREEQGRELDLGNRELPSNQAVHNVVDRLCAILFPMRLGPPDLTKERENQFVAYSLGTVERDLVAQACLELGYAERNQRAPETLQNEAGKLVVDLVGQLPELRRKLDEDVLAAYSGDPAATCVVIGETAVIGGNVWLTQSVAPESQISQASLQQR